MRVGLSPTRYVYPDLSAVCGEAETGDGATTLLNPVFVVEVISPTSVERDRERKVELYGAAPSIQGYLILDQEPRICGMVHSARRAAGDCGNTPTRLTRLN